MVTASLSDRVDRAAGAGPRQLVVRTRGSSVFRWVVIVLCGVGAIALVALAFEAGRRMGQGEWRQGSEQLRTLALRVGEQAQENERLRRELASVSTARGIEQRAQEETRRMLVDLEGEVQRQREELDFYRTIVSPDDGVAGLRIQNLRIRRGGPERRFQLQLVLVQAAKHDKPVAGVVEFLLEGVQDGEPRSLTARELLADAASERETLPFSFRYFADLERVIELPSDFVPRRIEVKVSPDGKSGQVLRQTFDWAAIS